MNLSKAELERLAILAEECGEVVQIVNKIIRHGYDSYHPEDDKKVPNRTHLERELGDLAFIVNFCGEKNDISYKTMGMYREHKKKTIQKYLHHNTVDLDNE